MLRKAICRGRHGLALTIAVTSPVLNQLCDRRIITDEQRNEIEAINPREQYNRANRLLDFLVQRTEEKHFDIVCDVFKKEIQNGVVTMLEKNLAQESAESDSGYASFEAQQPIGTSSYTRQTHAHQQADSAMSTEACFTNQLDQAQEIVEENLSPELFERLENLIEPDDLLPEYLYSNECMVIDQREFERIKQENKFTERIVVLLKVLRKKLESPWSCSRVHEALKACRQLHVSHYITYNEIHCIECGDNWPLADHQRRLLQHPLLIKGLDLSGFLDKMVTLECISDHQRKNVTSLMTSSSVDECVSRFLRMLQRRSLADYKKFFTNVVAEPTLPMDIKGLFLKTLAIALVHSNVVSQTDENVTRLENAAVTKLLSDLLKDQNWMNQLTAERRLPRLLYASHVESINWYFNCTSVDEVERLKKAYDSGELSTCLEEIFNRACGCLDGRYRLEISWSIDDYRSCLEYLNSSFVDWMASVVRCTSRYQQSVVSPQSTLLQAQRSEIGQNPELLQATSTPSCWKDENATIDVEQLPEAKKATNEQVKDSHLLDLVSEPFSRLLDETNKLPREQQLNILWSALDEVIPSAKTPETKRRLLGTVRAAYQSDFDMFIHCGGSTGLQNIVDSLPSIGVDDENPKTEEKPGQSKNVVEVMQGCGGADEKAAKEEKPQQSAIQLVNDERLLGVIEYQFGLLGELCRREILNRGQIEMMKSKARHSEVVRQLLDEVNKISIEQQERFLSALDETKQSHVTNFIRNKGQRPTTDSDIWPLIGTSMIISLRQNWHHVIELIDSRNGLLDELLSVQCISMEHFEYINVASLHLERNERLLEIISRRSVLDYRMFIDCLRKTEQSHVVSFLVPDITPFSRLFSERKQKILQILSTRSAGLIYLAHSDLIESVVVCDVLSREQRDYVLSASTKAESVERLLIIVMESSEDYFDKFVCCLRNTGLEDVARLLLSETDAVNVLTHSTAAAEAEKELIVSRLERMFQSASPQRKQEMGEAIKLLILELLGVSVRLGHELHH